LSNLTAIGAHRKKKEGREGPAVSNSARVRKREKTQGRGRVKERKTFKRTELLTHDHGRGEVIVSLEIVHSWDGPWKERGGRG